MHDLLHAASAGSEGPAVPPQPATTASQQPSTPTPAAAEGPAPAVARPLLSFTLHGSDDQPAAVTALCHDPSDASGCSLFAACGSVLHRVDTRTAGGVVQRYGSSREEVNGVAVSGKGAHLAAGDDAGEIQVYDLAAGACVRMLVHLRLPVAVCMKCMEWRHAVACCWAHLDVSWVGFLCTEIQRTPCLLQCWLSATCLTTWL